MAVFGGGVVVDCDARDGDVGDCVYAVYDAREAGLGGVGEFSTDLGE